MLPPSKPAFSSFKFQLFILFTSLLPPYHNKMMSSKGISLAFLVAIFAAFTCTHVMVITKPSLLKYLYKIFGITTFSSSSCLSPLSSTSVVKDLMPCDSFDGHHHHNKKDKKTTSICDDFPPNIPPPGTNTTSFICVDSNGCCNFTTVQSAIDAVGNLSVKRTVIWINSGIYL